jgi:transcriptional regulator with XRE-family HTH domain
LARGLSIAVTYIPIGQRIGIIRRSRGMTQEQVAGQLGMSGQWLSNIERGVRTPDRYSVLVPIARVLKVTVAELIGERPVSTPGRVEGQESALAVRLALAEPMMTTPNGDRPPSVDHDELSARVRGAWSHVHDARYQDFGVLAPKLLRDCEHAVRDGGSERRNASLRLLAELYQAIAAMMAKLGEHDAAWVAGDRSVFAAMQAGDAVLAAAGAFRLGHVFLDSGRLDHAEHTTASAATAVEPAARAGAADAMALWGALWLVQAVAAARGRDRDSALSATARAEDVAARLGAGYEERRFDTEFGAANVAAHGVAVAVELGDSAEALRRSTTVDVTALSPERRARLLVDVARAHAQRRARGAAVAALEQAEQLAPEMVRSDRLARDTVRDLLRRERGRSKRGRLDLAARMGLL